MQRFKVSNENVGMDVSSEGDKVEDSLPLPVEIHLFDVGGDSFFGTRGGVCENGTCRNNGVELDYKAVGGLGFVEKVLMSNLKLKNNQLIIKKHLLVYLSVLKVFNKNKDLSALIGIPLTFQDIKEDVDLTIEQKINSPLKIDVGYLNDNNKGQRLKIEGLAKFELKKTFNKKISKDKKTYYLLFQVFGSEIETLIKQLQLSQSSDTVSFEITVKRGKDKDTKTFQIVLEK